MAKVTALRGLQPESSEGLSALILSILDEAYKGELLPPSRPSPKFKLRIWGKGKKDEFMKPIALSQYVFVPPPFSFFENGGG
jgi:hypothetical protein